MPEMIHSLENIKVSRESTVNQLFLRSYNSYLQSSCLQIDSIIDNDYNN